MAGLPAAAQDGQVRLGGIARPIVVAGWGLLGFAFVGLAGFAGVDTASTILFSLAIAFLGCAVYCAGRAIDAQGLRAKALWVGRMLGLIGAAIAVSFPAILYQEIAVVIASGDLGDLAWLPTAIWYQLLVMPLVVVPAFLSLRWSRAAAVLFVLDGLLNIVLAVVKPFGDIFPDATASGFIPIPILDVLLQPGFVAAFFLLVGSGAAKPRSGASTLHPVRA